MMPDDPFAHILAFPLSFQVLPLHRKHPRHAWHASALYFSDCFPRPSLKQTIYGSRPEGCMPPCLSKFQLVGPSMSLHTLRFLRLLSATMLCKPISSTNMHYINYNRSRPVLSFNKNTQIQDPPHTLHLDIHSSTTFGIRAPFSMTLRS